MKTTPPAFCWPQPPRTPADQLPDLDALVAKWQKVLRLQDWTVAIKWGRSFDLAQGKEATTRSSLSAKLAAVTILDPADYDPDSMLPQDIENTVIHELLHLHTWPFDHALADSLEARCVEQAIEAIAAALVMLDRRVAQ